MTTLYMMCGGAMLVEQLVLRQHMRHRRAKAREIGERVVGQQFQVPLRGVRPQRASTGRGVVN